MNQYFKTILSLFQTKSTEYLVEDVSYSTEISFKNILWGSLIFCVLTVVPFIALGPFGLLFAGPTAMVAFISSFLGIFINAAVSTIILKIAKSPVEYKKVVNLFAYFVGLAGIPMIFNVIPVVGSLLLFISSLFLFYLQMKCLSELSGVSIGKLVLLHILIGILISFICMICSVAIGFASLGLLM